jgi:hypothetical protein
MSTLDFFVAYCMGPIALTILGVSMYVVGVREQRRYFAQRRAIPIDRPRHRED